MSKSVSFSILFRTDLNSISISFSRRGEPPRTPLLGEKDVPIVFESVQFFLRIWTRNLRFYIDFPQKTHQNTAIFEGFSLFISCFRKLPIFSFSIMYVRRRSIIERTSLRVCTAQPLLTVVRYTTLRLSKIVVVRTVRTAGFRKRK